MINLKAIAEKQAIYKLNLELDSHDATIIQLIFGVKEVAKIVHKTFPEYSEEEVQAIQELILQQLINKWQER